MERTLEKSAAPVLVPAIAVTDGELLMRFAQHGDEQAFAALVEKHGRLVWAICWQVLREHHAIEDAFQSTFFILAKRARTIRSCDSLCGWLYRVAYRTALRARMSTKAKPLSALGTEADTMEEWSEFDEKLRAIEQDEQRIALLEELHALPEKYQQVLALCYLEGKTRRGIADELGCSMETVKGRLARGRQVLRHRLIRRGVSLSLAMAAMTVPVQSATAAVTPGLIGLTVTGATAWAAGTLGAAKIASGAGAAKAAATASSQVIHLAQQGTVAMTIASFAKPAVVAVALLGAVSGTLAVDSSDAQKGGGEAQTINLAVGAASEAAADAAVADEAPIVTVAAIEESATENGDSDSNKKSKPQTWTVEDFVVEKKRMPAPPRSPQPIKIRAPGVPANVIIPDVPPMPEMPVVAPLDIHVPRFNLKLQLKLAALEAHVSELLLESKNLEIEAMSAAGEEEQQVLLQKSREKLTRAEAEKLKIQLEQQKEQIKALEEALREQTEQFGKQAAKMAAGAEVIAAQAEKAAGAAEAQAAIQAKEAAQHAAKAALRIQERAVIFDQASGRTLVANQYPVVSGLPNWEQSIEAQQGALSLKPGDRIQIEAIGAFPDKPINDVFTIEPMGTVALGAAYGRTKIEGLSILDAEQVILEHLKTILSDVQIQVTYLHPTVTYTSPYAPSVNSGEFRYAPASNVKPSKVDESK